MPAPDRRAGANGARRPTADATASPPSLAEGSARRLRIALAQINATVGDLGGNARRIEQGIRAAAEAGAHLVCFPELALTGYPPEDLLLKPRFISDNLLALADLARVTADLPGLTAIVGFADRDVDLYNAAAVLHGGRIAGRYHKQFLPN